jgi:hypothetical protein
MQCACAILNCRLWAVRLYHIFPHYLIKGMIFGGEKVIEHKMFFDYSPNLSEIFLISRIIQRDIVINMLWSSCKVKVILFRF